MRAYLFCMSITTRIDLYTRLEKMRGRPLIIFVTGNRTGAQAQIAGDCVEEFLAQLQALPASADELDLFLVSLGGDPTVAWRLVSLVRERVKKFSVLVPQAAYSAATLIALGADEIVMHPHGNLGPTDPQIVSPNRDGAPGVRFGSEDLGAFLRFSKEEVGLSDQEHLFRVFEKFCNDVGAIPIGTAARGSQLSITMGEKLLKLHMTDENEKQEANRIAQALTKDFFHHGYPLGRTEAKQIGLKIADRDRDTEALIWEIWSDLAEEMLLRKPFMPLGVLRNDPNCAAMFEGAPQIEIPPNLPPDIQQQVLQKVLSSIKIKTVPPSQYQKIHAVMESCRHASRYMTKGQVFGHRTPNMEFKLSDVSHFTGWESLEFPAPRRKKRVVKKSARRKKKT